MDYSSGFKIIFAAVFGNIYMALACFVGLAISVAFSLWTQTLGRRLYLIFVLICSVPLVAIASLPLYAPSGSGRLTNEHFIVMKWLIFSLFASPFAAGVLLGALLSPLSRWLKTVE
jgi:hypothetical protein